MGQGAFVSSLRPQGLFVEGLFSGVRPVTRLFLSVLIAFNRCSSVAKARIDETRSPRAKLVETGDTSESYVGAGKEKG